MDVLLIALSLTFLGGASIFWYLWISNSSKGGAPPLPPGPRGLPILGYLPFVELNLHKQLAKLAHEHGPIYKLWLGSKLYIVLSSPQLVKAVVRDHDSVFANRDPPAAAIVATSALDIFWSPNGSYWRDMRKLFVREMLSNKNLQSSYALRVDEVREFVRGLRDEMLGKAVDIGDLVFRIEVSVLMSLLWGATIDGEERERVGAEFRISVSKFVDVLGKPNISDFLPQLARFDLQGVAKEMRDVLPKVDRVIDWIIDRRMNMMRNGEGRSDDEEGRKKDFLEILLELKGQKIGDDSTFDLVQIKAVLLDIIVGGTDTTATTVEWAMAELLNNPDVMRKVEEEVAGVVGSNDSVEESHLPKLQYLEAVVKESMRLHPPLPLIVPRFPSQSTTIGGYTIPKGSRVFLNMWSIHMDPELWENPTEFRPDRFLQPENKNLDYSGNSFQYLPFGSGRRLCPGLALAERMVMLLLATLVHSFEWRLPNNQDRVDLSEKFGIVMRKNTPLLAIPYQRQNNST